MDGFFKRNSSIILSCIGAAGVIATSVVVAKDTPKAMKLIEEAKQEKGDELTTVETVKAAAPAYIPAAVVGVSTIACIFGASILTRRQQASMVSAYALLENVYKQYTSKVKDIYGEEADVKVRTEIANDIIEENPEIVDEDDDGLELFFDCDRMMFFRSTVDKVMQKTTMDDGLECYIMSIPEDAWDAYGYPME